MCRLLLMVRLFRGLEMGQQMKFSEDNEEGLSPLSYSKPSLSPQSSINTSNIEEPMDLKPDLKCCFKHAFKDYEPINAGSCYLGSNDSLTTMKSVSLDTSDLPPMSVFSTCEVSSTNNSEPSSWNSSFFKSSVSNPDFGCQGDVLDGCTSQFCVKDNLADTHLVSSSCQLESAGLNCTFTTDIGHSQANENDVCNSLEAHNMINPELEDSCDMAVIKNYISDLDEDFGEYSASECEETNSSDYNIAELSTLHAESKQSFNSICREAVPEKLCVTFKGLTVATSNIKVVVYGDRKEYHCFECSHISSERCSIISHLGSHDGLLPFQCIICTESFSSEAEACAHYQAHFKDKKAEVLGSSGIERVKKKMEELNLSFGDTNTFSCEKCEKTFSSSSRLNSHINIHKISNDHSHLEFICPTCNATFNCFSELKSHEISHPSDQNHGKPSLKSKRKEKVDGTAAPSTKEKPKREKLSKTGRKWTCETCLKAFRTSKALREHEVVHTGARDFPCDICGKAFGTGANMRIHRLTHSDMRPFACQTCGATFRQKDSLKVHARKHTGERPYVCSVCKMTFDRSFTLKNHMLTHASEKLFVCSACGKTFSTRGGLNNHERLHFKDPVERKKEQRPRAKPGTGDWVCDECGKIYSTRSNLRMHQRTHQFSQVSHVCPVCAKVYKSRDSMEVHMRTHSEVRPYKCPICIRSFYRNYTLKLHILTHTGEKPHQCPVEGCDRSFAQTSSLSYHLRNHKKQEERLEKRSRKQKCMVNSNVTELPAEKGSSNCVDTDRYLISIQDAENCGPVNGSQELAVDHDLKMGMDIILPHNNSLGNVVSNNHGEAHMVTSVPLPDHLDHHLGHVPPVGWGDSISLIGIMHNVDEPPVPPALMHHSGNVNLQPQGQMVQLIPSETLPMLVTAPGADLFYQECSERSSGSGNQTMLLHQLS